MFKSEIKNFIWLSVFAAGLILPVLAHADVATDLDLYNKYQLYPKYEKKKKYAKYKKMKEKYGFKTTKEKADAKDAYVKYKLFKKDPVKYRSYAQFETLGKKYAKYKKYVTPVAKYSKYSKYNRKEYEKYKNYGGAAYRDGYNRYLAFATDLNNVTTNPGPEIRVGLWSSNIVDLADESKAFKLTASKPFRITNCAGGVVVPSVPVGENARVKYVSGGVLNVYNSGLVVPFTSDVGDKICFDAVDGNNLDMVFDVNRPALYTGDPGANYDRYRGKIKIQHSLDPNTDGDGNANCSLYQDSTFPAWDPENACRRVWVINELPMELYLWGYGEMSTGGIPDLAKTMMVAARSYARWWVEYATKWDNAGFDLIASPFNQIYNGYDYETSGTHDFIPAAARATNGIIMKYGSDIALGAYCSNTDGRTRSAEEAWGNTLHPYLKSVPDPYGAIANPSAGNHMVGLSANGAKVLAQNYGWNWIQILSYYYSGINILKEY